jgi:hypothetical protein
MKKNPFLEKIRKDTPVETKISVRHHADITIHINQLSNLKEIDFKIDDHLIFNHSFIL